MAVYLRPTSLDEALEALRVAPLTVLAGGTDHYPARVGRPLDDDVLDITALGALRGIEVLKEGWRIGALTTWSELRAAPLPPWFAGLRQAAREVGGAQIQNAATIGGNLCNASPAADGVPPLLAMAAEVELASGAGRDRQRSERLPLADFLRGNRQTARRPDQLLTAIWVPRPRSTPAAGHFLKLGARRYLVISIVMVAANLALDAGGRVAAAGLAVGAAGPVARRLPAAEAALIGAPCDQRLAGRILAAHLAPLAPIDDIRASARYRQGAALVLARRAVAELAGQLAATP